MDEFARVVDKISDIDEATLTIGVDYHTVWLDTGNDRLAFDLEAAEMIGRALVSAAWEAGRNSALMEAAGIEISDA